MARFGVKQLRKFTVSTKVIPGKGGSKIKLFIPGLKR